VQLSTVRFLRTFLPDPTEVPRVVVDCLPTQLDIGDPSVLKGYGEGDTRWDQRRRDPLRLRLPGLHRRA
jgi:uncharacterized protein DUF4158